MTRLKPGFHLLVGALIIGATTIPYVYGALTTPPDSTFAWALGFLPDTLGNLAFTRQAAEGALLFINPYTGEPHPARFFNPLFLVLGWATKLTGLAPGLVLQLSRLVFAAIFLHALRALCARLFEDQSDRRLAFLLVALSGGLGFLSCVVPSMHMAADIKGAEMTTFFSIYQQAHFAAALAIIVWIALNLIKAYEIGSTSHGLVAGLLHLLLVSVHPYDAPVLFAVSAVYAAVIWHRRANRTSAAAILKPLALFLAIPLPLIAYYGYVSAFVPVYREFVHEGLRAPPWPIMHYALGYGALIPLAAIGVREILRERNHAWLFPAIWILTVPFLLALPIPARRKLMEGYHLFLCLVAMRGVLVLKPQIRLQWRTIALPALAILSLSSIYVMCRDIYSIDVSRLPERRYIRAELGRFIYPLNRQIDRLFMGSPWLHGILFRNVDRYDIPNTLLAALNWTAKHLDRRTVILAAPETGLLIPVFSPHQVMAGHLFQTLNARRKELAIRTFMDSKLPDIARRHLLDIHGIGAILWDPPLERLGEWRPPKPSKLWMRPLVHFDDTTVYIVSPGPAPRLASYIRAEIDASEFKLSGKGLLDRGEFHAAATDLERAIRLRPNDAKIREWLKLAIEHLEK